MSTVHAKTNPDRLPEGIRLSSRGLTVLLVLMCAIPVVTVLTLHFTLPSIEAGKLEADIRLSAHPDSDYYDQDIYKRKFIPEASVVLTNESDEAWQFINVKINNQFFIYDVDQKLKPGEQRRYLLSRFTNREGALFELRAQPVKEVLVFAKVASNKRYSITVNFEHE